MGFETVYVGFETVCPEKDKQTAFYSPLEQVSLRPIYYQLNLWMLLDTVKALSSNPVNIFISIF